VADPSFATYWNYLRRQLFVMDTYASAHNRRVNHTMLALHAYLSWAVVLPLLTGAVYHLTATEFRAASGARTHQHRRRHFGFNTHQAFCQDLLFWQAVCRPSAAAQATHAGALRRQAGLICCAMDNGLQMWQPQWIQ
jgi:hypothetical protein